MEFKLDGKVGLSITIDEEQADEVVKDYLVKKYGFPDKYYDRWQLWFNENGDLCRTDSVYHNDTEDSVVIENPSFEQKAAFIILRTLDAPNDRHPFPYMDIVHLPKYPSGNGWIKRAEKAAS
jgi:hypothetical protein